MDPKSVKINGTFKVIQSKDWSDVHNAFLHDEVTNYAKQNNWPLDLSYEGAFTGGGNFFQKIAAAVASGNGPDMLWGNYSTFQFWYLKTIQPLDDVMAAAQKTFGNTTPNNPPGNQFEGHWWTVPYFNRSGGWWARKSWFDAINVDVTKPMDFNGWVDAALKVSDASKRRWGWGITVNRSGDGTNNVSNPWYESGNRLTDETGQKVFFNTADSIAAFDWLKGIYTDAKYKAMLPPGVNAWDDMGNNNAWYAGTIGFTGNAGTIFATALKNEPAIGKDTIIVPQPAGPVGKKETLVGQTGNSSNFYLLQGAKNVDAAKAMIQYLLSKDIQTKLFENSQGYVYPAYDWGWDTAPVQNAPNGLTPIYKSQVYAQNQFAGWQPAPKPLLWVDAVGQEVIFTDTMAAILKGTATKAAVDDGQQKIEALVKKYNGQ